MPLRPDFLHCSRRWSANKPSGEEEEIVERGEPLLFFIAPAAAELFWFFPRKFHRRFGLQFRNHVE